jgi:dipicolinate synthase subunit A
VAKETTTLLTSLSCGVAVFARNPSQREDAAIKGCKAYPISKLSSLAGEFDIIINTIPNHIFTQEIIKNINANCKIIELASAPYGMDFELMRKNGIDVIKAFGLPGKYTPKTAGEIIGKKIETHLQKEE